MEDLKYLNKSLNGFLDKNLKALDEAIDKIPEEYKKKVSLFKRELVEAVKNKDEDKINALSEKLNTLFKE